MLERAKKPRLIPCNTGSYPSPLSNLFPLQASTAAAININKPLPGMHPPKARNFLRLGQQLKR